MKLTSLIILIGVWGMENNIQQSNEKEKIKERQKNMDTTDLKGCPSENQMSQDENLALMKDFRAKQCDDRFQRDLALNLASVPRSSKELFLNNGKENRDKSSNGSQTCRQSQIHNYQQTLPQNYTPCDSQMQNYQLNLPQKYTPCDSQMQNYQQKLPQNYAPCRQSQMQNYQQKLPQNDTPMLAKFFAGRCIGAIVKLAYARSMSECLQYCAQSPEWAPAAVSFDSGFRGGCACQSDLKMVATDANEPGWVCAVNSDMYNVKWVNAMGFYFEENPQKRKQNVLYTPADWRDNKN